MSCWSVSFLAHPSDRDLLSCSLSSQLLLLQESEPELAASLSIHGPKVCSLSPPLPPLRFLGCRNDSPKYHMNSLVFFVNVRITPRPPSGRYLLIGDLPVDRRPLRFDHFCSGSSEHKIGRKYPTSASLDS